MPPEAGGERTEPATPKRRQDARRKGQVAKTAELAPALGLLAAYAAISLTAPLIAENGVRMVRHGITAMADQNPLTISMVQQLFAPYVLLAAQVLAPIAAAVAGSAVAGQAAQVGFLVTSAPIAPQWQRLNPLAGLRRLWSRQGLVELLRSLIKTAFVAYMGWGSVRQVFQAVPELMAAPPAEAASMAGRFTGQLARTIGIVFVTVAAFDYLFQRWELEQSLRMSRKEVQEELKQSEGDPQIRNRIRQRQRKLAYSRMMAEVPRADVVVTNPIHLAVALRYDPRKAAAPVVVAKGAGFVAERIKELARQHRVPIVENVALARGLFAGAEVGSIIPPEFYQAVAEVLAFVYRLRKQRAR